MKEARKFLCLLIVLLIPALAFAAGKININTASVKQLSKALSGVGLKKASAIVQYRSKYGRFKRKQDLLRVRGIGRKTLARNEEKIILVSPSVTSEKKRSSSPISLINGHQSR